MIARLPVEEQRVDLAGVSTAVLRGGAGPPLVVLHGIGQFAATWTRLIPRLVPRYTVIAPDLPGQGASEVDERPLDSTRVLEWVGELVEATCPAPPVLLGHNVGGAIAARFASAHGDALAGLVLVDAMGLGPFRPTPSFAIRMLGFQTWPTEHTRDRLLGLCMVDLEQVNEEMGEDWDLLAAYALDRARTPAVKSAGRSLMTAFGLAPVPFADLACIGVPTTLVWGRQDPETRLRFAEAASERYGWPLHVIEDCGADPNIERPGALLDVLLGAAAGPARPATAGRRPTDPEEDKP